MLLTFVENVIRAIRSFPLSSSGGIGGLRSRHLKDLILFTCGESANRLLKAIASLVDIGRVQHALAKVLFYYRFLWDMGFSLVVVCILFI